MDKLFDKKKHERTLLISYLNAVIIGIIGIVSVILSIVFGQIQSGNYDINNSNSYDPKDYYGKYYIQKSYMYISFEFNENVCVYRDKYGVDDIERESHTYNYKYLSSDEAQKKYKDNSRVGCDAIFIYTDYELNQAIILWIVQDDPYEFVIDIDGISRRVTEYERTIKDDVPDPENYYGMYTNKDSNVVALINKYDNKGKISFLDSENNILETANFVFIDKKYFSTFYKGSLSSSYGLLLYDDFGLVNKVVQILTPKTIKYNNVVFTCTT